MTSVRGADELRGDANPFARLPHGAFEHRVDAELAANVTNVHLRLGDTKCRCARGHTEAGYLGQPGQQLLRQAVTEILDIAIGPKIDERQHGN